MTISGATATTTKASILEAVRELENVPCRMPGAETTVSLDEGLRWLDDSVRLSFAVDYRLVEDDDGVELWLLRWDPEEPRPPWPEPWPDPDEH